MHLTAVVFGLSLYANLGRFSDSEFDIGAIPRFTLEEPGHPRKKLEINDHLGYEYLRIARSIVHGDGYSSPFGSDTGPTAWMPPLFTYVLAGMIAIAGEGATMWGIVAIQNAVLVLTGLLIIGIARRASRRTTGAVLGQYTLFLLLYFRDLFQITHDHCFIMLWADVLLVLGPKLWDAPSPRRWAVFGIAGGLAALSSPALAAAWFVLCLAAPRRSPWRWRAVAVVACALVVSPWVIRNYVVFDELVLIKSNAFYEAYEMNYGASETGLVSWEVAKRHVGRNLDSTGADYRRKGEAAYLDDRKAEFIAAFEDVPARMLRNIKHRFVASQLVYRPYDEWMEQQQQQRSVLRRVLVWLVFPLPFVGLVVTLASWRKLASIQIFAIVLYAAYMAPYVLISYDHRYALPMLSVMALLPIWAVDAVRARVISRRQRA